MKAELTVPEELVNKITEIEVDSLEFINKNFLPKKKEEERPW